MIVSVARATGQPFHVVAKRPFAETMYVALHLQELDWRDDMRARFGRLESAAFAGVAFNEPKKLQDIHRRMVADARPRPTVDDLERRRDDALALLAEIQQIDAAGTWTTVTS